MSLRKALGVGLLVAAFLASSASFADVEKPVYCEQCPKCGLMGASGGRIARGSGYVTLFTCGTHLWVCALDSRGKIWKQLIVIP